MACRELAETQTIAISPLDIYSELAVVDYYNP